MQKVKKIVLGLSAVAMVMGSMAIPASSYAATTVLQHGNNLGDAFILNRLFSGDRILGGNSSDRATLGNLFILDQLFPKSEVTTAQTGGTTTTRTTATVRTLAQTLRGRIVIQVEEQGQAWYINPVTERRTFLGPKPEDAFNAMSRASIGVSNEEFASYGNTAPNRLAGRFIIKPEDAGQLYYVNPTDLSINYISGPSGALQLIQRFGTGITNNNLAKISVTQ